MSKIARIHFEVAYRTIPVDFDMELKDFTVITGVNNSGKTNFIEAIDKRKCLLLDENGSDMSNAVEAVYVPAESILGDEQFKLGKTSEVVKIIEKFIDGDPTFQLSGHETSKANIDDIVQSVNSKINKLLTGGDPSKKTMEISIQESLSLKEFLEKALVIKPIDYQTNHTHLKFEELGQGWQRLVIATFLLVTREKKADTSKLQLVLFEEPEAYLHPQLKKDLVGMLKSIASNNNSQVIVTTHDPYIAYTSVSDNSVVYSFERNSAGLTLPSKPNKIFGIEDELLHIALFKQFLVQKSIVIGDPHYGSGGTIDSFFSNCQGNRMSTYISDKNSPTGTSQPMSLTLSIRNQIHHPENKYTISGQNSYSDTDLLESIKFLNSILA